MGPEFLKKYQPEINKIVISGKKGIYFVNKDIYTLKYRALS